MENLSVEQLRDETDRFRHAAELAEEVSFMEVKVKYRIGELLPLCLWCGECRAVYHAAYGHCAIKFHYDEGGQQDHIDEGTKHYKHHSDVLRCTNCGHVRRELQEVGDQVEARSWLDPD